MVVANRIKVTYLAGEKTLGKAREHGSTVVVLAVQRLVLLLGALAMEHVVLALFSDRRYEVQLGRDVECLLDLARTPFGCAPVESPTLFDHPVKCTDNFFHRNWRNELRTSNTNNCR